MIMTLWRFQQQVTQQVTRCLPQGISHYLEGRHRTEHVLVQGFSDEFYRTLSMAMVPEAKQKVMAGQSMLMAVHFAADMGYDAM
jgi:hypothetical protein